MEFNRRFPAELENGVGWDTPDVRRDPRFAGSQGDADSRGSGQGLGATLSIQRWHHLRARDAHWIDAIIAL
jgi:hypothetical protein